MGDEGSSGGAPLPVAPVPPRLLAAVRVREGELGATLTEEEEE